MISQSDTLNQKLNYLIEYMGKIKRSIAISGAKGDVIGVGVDGNNNIIFKELNINISNEFRGTYGLNVLSQDHFKEFKGTEENFKGWTKGFPFSLESIYNHKDFRREALLSNIKKMLENQKRLLLLGESGTSKSTLLMEIMCDYFDNGYVVLYNFGDEEPKNAMEIVQFVRNLVKAGNKVLIAVDNVHDKKMAIIYHIINILESFINKENIRFLLTARLPEYRWLLERKLSEIDAQSYRDAIELFDENSDLKYEIPFFNEEECRSFIKYYQDNLSDEKKTKSIDENARDIFNDTAGHPVMVKFSVLGEGLMKDVRNRYFLYLHDEKTPNNKKMQTVFVCSLFHISTLQITDELLDKMGLLVYANDLDRAILYNNPNKTWTTLHPRWDVELNVIPF